MSNAREYTLTEAIQAIVETELLELHTALPAEITKYNSGDQTCQIKIGLNRLIAGDEIVYPILDDIPVIFPRSSSNGFVFPLNPGDTALLIFSQRNLDRWLDTGGGQLPLDSRKFDVNDAIVIPGLYTKSGRVENAKDASTVFGKKLFLGDPDENTTPIITTGAGPGTPAGKPVNVLPEELDIITIISSLIDLVDGAVYGVTPAGPAGGGGGIDLESSNALQGLKSDLEKLKV